MKLWLRGWRSTAILSLWGLAAASSCQVDKPGYAFDDGSDVDADSGGAGRSGNAGTNVGRGGGVSRGGESGVAGEKTTGLGGVGLGSGGTGPQPQAGSDDVSGRAGALNLGGAGTAGATDNGGGGMGGTSAGAGTLNLGGTAGSAGRGGSNAAGKGGTSFGGGGSTVGKGGATAAGGAAAGGAAAGAAGSAGAVNLNTNPDHCGALARACSTANVNVRSCEGGLCSSTCKAGSWNARWPAAPLADDGCEAECPVTAGSSSMLRLPEGYCIDKTEVSRGQYQAWLDTEPSTSGQTTDCSWNATFVPGESCLSTAYQGTGAANHPMVCVDWCDASAYCRAMGKRLCGRIGGGTNAFLDHADATRSQWYNACVSGPTNNAYPYAAQYRSLACNGAEYQADQGTSTTVPVGTLSACQAIVAGYSGAFDLSGNVWEWEDSCLSTSLSAKCRARGGAYFNSEMLLRCDDTGDFELQRDSFGSYLGLRCCAN